MGLEFSEKNRYNMDKVDVSLTIYVKIAEELTF